MRRVIISAGHGGTDPGASGNGYIERDLAIEFRNLLVSELKKLGISAIIDDDKNALKQTLLWLKGKFSSGDILLDIHWNASANPEANGTEVIVPEKASAFELNLAKELLKCFTGFGFRDRGVKPETHTARKTLGWMRPNAETVLLEKGFISNKTDVRLYDANKEGIARRVAALLHQSSK